MKLKVNYFDNLITFNYELVQTIEIENKKMFYKFISDLFLIKNGEKLNEIYFCNDKNEELNLGNKIDIFANFFEIDFNSKKNINNLNKKINNNLTEIEKIELINSYKKMYKSFSKILNSIDLPIVINNDLIIEDIIKFFKIEFQNNNNLLNKLLLLIDIENSLRLNEMIFFVNLKQYLNKEELEEFYKYSIYNNINIVLIDSQSYGPTINYEKKLIIDNELDEYML